MHSHTPVASNKTIYKVNAEAKALAKDTFQAPATIISTIISNCQENCRVYLPNKEAQKQKIRRVRNKNKIQEPTCIENIIIPENLKYVDGELFVLNEKEFDGGKNIILGTIGNLMNLSKCDVWLMDGTFQVVPIMMRQLFTIHGKIGDQIIPLIYVIMTSKSLSSYNEAFYELCNLACANDIPLNPKFIISDFEKASLSAAATYFPSSIQKGCFFHFGQIIWRRIQREKLSSRYGNDECMYTK